MDGTARLYQITPWLIRHLAIFYYANKERHGGRVTCLQKERRVLAENVVVKNGKEAIFLPAFQGSACAPLLSQPAFGGPFQSGVGFVGLDLPTAVRIFFKKSIAVGALPFELRNDAFPERWNIYKEARKSIQKNNVPELSLDEINAEISAARSGM